MTRREAEARVWRLVEAARRIQDARDPLGAEARRVLPAATGLSPEGVELALCECLEVDPQPDELHALSASVATVGHAHVLLSANVFVGAFRAIALALSASDQVSVRPSRRAPEMTALLARAAPSLFRIVPRLEPASPDHVWAYGSDETLEVVRRELPAGCVLHAHGAGLGIVVVGGGGRSQGAIEALASSVAADVVPFDQRGCLSPRIMIVLGTEAETFGLGERLAEALVRIEARVPRGKLHPDEVADAARYRDAMCVSGTLLTAGSGLVGIDVNAGPLVVPPPGRHVHVTRTARLAGAAAVLRGLVTVVGVDGDPALVAAVEHAFPGARITAIGRMQRPPLDGPVDLRARRAGSSAGPPLC